MSELTEPSPRRPWLALSVAAVLVLSGLGVAGYALVNQGTDLTPAPLPSSTFSLAVPPVIPEQAAKSGMTPEKMAPSRILIPSLDVYAPLVDEKVTNDSLTLPTDLEVVGMDTGGAPVASTVGTTLLAGHVSQKGSPGVLHDLAKLKPGSQIYVTDAAGALSRFAVTGSNFYRKADLPQDVFDETGPRRLVLVTCGGPVIGKHYRDNVVVTALPAL